MAPETQAKVLRVLEGQPFERVGGSRPIQIDLRVIAATNKDLTERISSGLFREDLYYRLNVIPFTVPPLRERREDITLLATHFLKLFTLQTAQKNKVLTAGAIDRLNTYHWPGNIRELKNIMERIVIMVPDEVIEEGSIPVEGAGGTPAAARGKPLTFREARLDFEKHFLAEALERNRWNVTQTARELKLERSHLHKKIKFFDIRQE